MKISHAHAQTSDVYRYNSKQFDPPLCTIMELCSIYYIGLNSALGQILTQS